MIFKHKKAQGGPQWTLIEYILVFITLVIMIAVILRITGVWSSAVTESTCKASVYARSSAVVKGTQLVSLKCATQYKCFTAGGKCPTGYDKVTVANDNEIKQKLAEEMYSCWEMLGQSKIRFTDYSAISEKVCLPCSIITFDDNLKGRQITGFQTYLETANTSSGVTYAQYLTNAKEIDTGGDNSIIDTSKDYAVVYSLYSYSYLSKAVGGGAGVISGTIISFYTGPAIGFAAGGGVGALTTLGTSKLFNALKISKEITPAISLDEYSAENLKDCKSFVNI